jgi:hypothetical protein
MSDAVMITEWYVVHEGAASNAPLPFTRRRQPEHAAGLAAATAGPLWAWADGTDDEAHPTHWHGPRALSANGRAQLFEVRPPTPLRPLAPATTTPRRRPVVLPMAPGLLRAMSLASVRQGRAEGEIWAEAAREWLARHQGDDPEPPTPGASAPVWRAERDLRTRCWSAIDVLMGDLRAPLPTTEDEPEDEPAA